MNYTLPEFDEELYKSLVEIVAVQNWRRYQYADKNIFISNLSGFLSNKENIINVDKKNRRV